MTHFLFDKINKVWTINPNAELNIEIQHKLEPNVYSIQLNDVLGYHLTQALPFSLPEKRYGENKEVANRVYTTFRSRKGGTGIVFSGEKGSGKTLLMKTLALMGQADSLPTLIVNHAFFGTEFNNFIQKIDQECIIIFDEFEKVYRQVEWQENLLSLLDGVYNSKKLFLFSANKTWGCTEYMFNRPGRVFYHIHYESLSERFVREYCEDRLKDKTKIDDVISLSSAIRKFNFDMLQSLIEEMNRYDESVKSAMKYLNISLEKETLEYRVLELLKGNKKLQIRAENKFVSLSLLSDQTDEYSDGGFRLYYTEYEKDFSEDLLKPVKISNSDDDDDDEGVEIIEKITDEDEDYDIREKQRRIAKKLLLKKIENPVITSGNVKFSRLDIIKSEKNNKILTLKNYDDFYVKIELVEREKINYRTMLY